MAVVAVIQRLILSPAIATEYLSLDEWDPSKRKWSTKREEAKEFESFMKADDRAAQIRAQTGDMVHAANCEKPIPRPPLPVALAVRMDPKRAAQVRRDPVDA